MTDLTISFKSNAQDVRRFVCYLSYRTVSGRLFAGIMLSMPLLMNWLQLHNSQPHSKYHFFLLHHFWLITSFLYVSASFIVIVAFLLGASSDPERSVTISREFYSLHGVVSMKSPWCHFLRLDEDDDYFYFIGWHRAGYVPKRAFRSQAEADVFFETAIRYWCEAKGLPVPVRAAPDLSGVWPPAPFLHDSEELDGKHSH